MKLEALHRNNQEAPKEEKYSMQILGRDTVGRWTSNAFEMGAAQNTTLRDAALEIKRTYHLPESVQEILAAALDFRKLLPGAREHEGEIDPHEKDSD